MPIPGFQNTIPPVLAELADGRLHIAIKNTPGNVLAFSKSAFDLMLN